MPIMQRFVKKGNPSVRMRTVTMHTVIDNVVSAMKDGQDGRTFPVLLEIPCI